MTWLPHIWVLHPVPRASKQNKKHINQGTLTRVRIRIHFMRIMKTISYNNGTRIQFSISLQFFQKRNNGIRYWVSTWIHFFLNPNQSQWLRTRKASNLSMRCPKVLINQWCLPFLATNQCCGSGMLIPDTESGFLPIRNRLDTQKSHNFDPHFMTIPMSGHNPYFRLTVNILYFLWFC